MTTNLRTIIVEVGQWVNQQPWGQPGCPPHKPEYGVVEEFGKLIGKIFQNYMGIRGDRPDLFKRDCEMAFGYMMIHLSHWCYCYDAHYVIMGNMSVFKSESFHISQCLIAITQLVDASTPEFELTNPKAVQVATRIATCVASLAAIFHLNIFEDCLFPTWDKMKKRNDQGGK